MGKKKQPAKGVCDPVEAIGWTAGEVWQFLYSEESASVTALVKHVKVPRDQVMQAVGWLAREGKIAIHEEKRGKRITLVE